MEGLSSKEFERMLERAGLRRAVAACYLDYSDKFEGGLPRILDDQPGIHNRENASVADLLQESHEDQMLPRKVNLKYLRKPVQRKVKVKWHGKPVHVDDDSFCRRPDGSLVLGLTRSEWEAYVQKYTNVHPKKLVHLRDTQNTPKFDRLLFRASASYLDGDKAKEKMYGKPAKLATSLFMLLSVHVKPKSERKPFSVHGEITSNDGFLYKSSYIYRSDVASDSDGNLILNGPSEQCWPDDASFVLQSRKLSITLYGQQGQGQDDLLLFDGHIVLDYSPDEFEHVAEKEVHNSEISITFKYVSIPMGVCGRLELYIGNTKFLEEKDTKLSQQVVKVCGKVVATYKNTFGNYNSEEIVLFDKNPKLNQYQMLDLDKEDNLLSSARCWVAAPVFSLLDLHIHLSNFETDETILDQHVELRTHHPDGSRKILVAGAFCITASAMWTAPSVPPDDFEDDSDGDDDGGDDDDDDAPSVPPDDFEDDGGDDDDDDGDQISRSLEPCTPPPPSHSAIEIFSVLICHKEECAKLEIHGHLQFTFDWAMDFEESGIDIFKKEEEDPLRLFGRSNTIIPVLNRCRLPNLMPTFSVVCDLKDSLDSLSIKGHHFGIEEEYFLRPSSYRERQMCSIFRGDNGFAALHYSIFSSAVQVHLKVTCKQKESEGVNSDSVLGSLHARYAGRDYSSQYKKDCYRIVLFEGSRDLVQKDDDRLVPLSRSSFIVPLHSSAIFDVDLKIGTQKFCHKIEVPIGRKTECIQDKKCKLTFELKWSEVN